eukprot:1355500-Amphidinium_carterae.1
MAFLEAQHALWQELRNGHDGAGFLTRCQSSSAGAARGPRTLKVTLLACTRRAQPSSDIRCTRPSMSYAGTNTPSKVPRRPC